MFSFPAGVFFPSYVAFCFLKVQRCRRPLCRSAVAARKDQPSFSEDLSILLPGRTFMCQVSAGVVAAAADPAVGCCVTLSSHLLQALAAILDVLLCFPLSVPKSRKNNVLEDGNSSVLNPNNRLMYSWGQGSLRVNGALAGRCQRLWLQTVRGLCFSWLP